MTAFEPLFFLLLALLIWGQNAITLCEIQRNHDELKKLITELKEDKP